MMDIYDKFVEEINFERGFKWRPEWSALEGIENSIDYVSELTDISNLETYSPMFHLNGFFTGFVNVLGEGLHVNEDFKEANYLYIEKGVIRYLQHFEKNNCDFYQNFSFFNDHFALHKSYFWEEQGILEDVGLEGKFKLYDLNILFSRDRNESNISIGSRYDKFVSILIPEEKIISLSKEVFRDYENLYSFFEGFKTDVYAGSANFARDVPFREAIEIIK